MPLEALWWNVTMKVENCWFASAQVRTWISIVSVSVHIWNLRWSHFFFKCIISFSSCWIHFLFRYRLNRVFIDRLFTAVHIHMRNRKNRSETSNQSQNSHEILSSGKEKKKKKADEFLTKIAGKLFVLFLLRSVAYSSFWLFSSNLLSIASPSSTGKIKRSRKVNTDKNAKKNAKKRNLREHFHIFSVIFLLFSPFCFHFRSS